MKIYDSNAAEILLHKCAAANIAKIKANQMVPESSQGQTYVVKVSEFMAELKRAGIAYPSNFIEYHAWMQPIAKRVLPKYRKQLAK